MPGGEFLGDFVQAGADGGDVLLTPPRFLGGAGTAVAKQHAAGQWLAAVGILELMLQDGELVVFLRQRGVVLAAPLLLLGKVRGGLPLQLGRVLIIKGLIVAPGHRAQKTVAVTLQAGDVFGREGAAVRD